MIAPYKLSLQKSLQKNIYYNDLIYGHDNHLKQPEALLPTAVNIKTLADKPRLKIKIEVK